VRKEGLRRTIGTILLFLFFGAVSAMGQPSGPSSAGDDNSALPDAPSATQMTTCTQNNGKSCPWLVNRIVGQYPPLPELGTTPSQRPANFLTYRRRNDPPLRTNKQVFQSWPFVLAHVGGGAAMAVACGTKYSGETWGTQVPIVAALFGMDYIQFRFVGGPNAIGAPVYEMVHYGLASAR